MVSADNVNIDVLELIFAYLPGHDLTAVALVSRTFLSGAIPKLYSYLFFRISQAKRYPKVLSPFATILAHPELAVHVRHVEIRTVPRLRSQIHTVFISDCSRALALCRNLSSFNCTVDCLPPLLFSLDDKDGLQSLRVHANLNSKQAPKLLSMTKLCLVTLDFASWNVMDVLPMWAGYIQNTLTTLTLYMCADLNETVLESSLLQLPKLLGLHVISSPQIDHVTILKLVVHTPVLESLSFTVWETSCSLSTSPPLLPHLRHLALDARYTHIPSPTQAIITKILSHLSPSLCGLSSFKIKLSNPQITIGYPLVQQILETLGSAIKYFSFLDCSVETQSISEICRRCTHLERLDVAIPVKQLIPFTGALSGSSSLHTLCDVGDSHISHGPRTSLTQQNVRHIMGRANSIKKIVSGSRMWTGHQTPGGGDQHVSLERRKAQAASNHWFTPRD